MNKSDERTKAIIKEVVDEQHREISSHILGIFIWGFWFGVVGAYSQTAPIIIGIVMGYILAKKNFTIVDQGICRLTLTLMRVRDRAVRYQPEDVL